MIGETIDQIVDFIALNFLGFFGLYSLLFFLFLTFWKNKNELIEFDKSAIRLTLWVGTFWIVLKLVGLVFLIYRLKKDTDSLAFSQHLTWFIENIWFQFLFWIALSQALRFGFISKNLIPRLLISFFFVFSFNAIETMMDPNHPNYWLNTQSWNNGFFRILVNLKFRTIAFILIVGLFHFGRKSTRNV